MTDPETTPSGTEPPRPQPQAAAAEPGLAFPNVADATQLTQYLSANRARFTEEALADAARRSGYADDVIQRALAESRAAEDAAPIRSRAIRTIVIAYVATYVLLDVGMILNTEGQRYLTSAVSGIGVLTVSLVVAFVASMVWLASRWAFGVLFFIALALATLPMATSYLQYPQYSSPTAFIAPAIGVLGFVWLIWSRRGGRAPSAGTPTLEVLLVVPILLMLGVAGLCLASGMPIPRAA